MSVEIVPSKVTRATAIRIVREIAQDTTDRFREARAVAHAGAADRCDPGLSLPENGRSRGGSLAGHQDWCRCTFESFAAGERIKVAVAFNTTESLVVITVM